MNIEALTIKEAREIASMFAPRSTATTEVASYAPFDVGANYFIRTVTHHFTGQLVAVHDKELVLSQACWIADDGRFADALKTETFKEVEPYPVGRGVIIGRASIIDMVQIKKLPTEQK